MSDDRQVPGVPEQDEREHRPNQPDETGYPDEDRSRSVRDDYKDVPEPLKDEDSDSGIGGTTDPEASRNRREGLKKDDQLESESD